jgi:cysteine-rich repeat protein
MVAETIRRVTTPCYSKTGACHRRYSWAMRWYRAAVLILVPYGCSVVSGLEDYEANGLVGGGDGDGGSLVGGGGDTAVGGQGGTGGAPPPCGNSVLDGDEQCDDGNVVSGDSCDEGCQVECQSGFEDPQTHHCYLHVADDQDWFEAYDHCLALGPGWDLVAVSSQPENIFLDDVVDPSTFYWTGGNDQTQEGEYEWTNGEPWDYVPWGTGDPDGTDCVYIDPETGEDVFRDANCTSNALDSVCELTPAGS